MYTFSDIRYKKTNFYVITAVQSLILLLSSVNVFAAPTISTIAPSTIAKGSQVTITGSVFGAKSPAAPILWENFEDGVNGTALSTTGKWVKYANAYNGGTFSNVAAYSGNLSAYNNVRGSDFCSGCTDSFTLREFNMSTYTFDPTDTVYYSYNWRYEAFGNALGTVKAGRINTGTNQYNGEGSTSLTAATVKNELLKSQNTSFAAWMEYVDATSPDYSTHLPYSSYVTPTPIYGAWERHEIFKKLSTPGVADGQVEWSINNVIVKQLTNYITRPSGYTGKHTSVALALMMANPQPSGDVRFWVDDVYVDNTRSRVEICSGNTWLNRIKCNIQIPTSWTDNKIIFTSNVSQFTNGTFYLYVVNANGEVNSNGYAVVIGGISSPKNLTGIPVK